MAWALERRPELLDLALAERPSVVALSFGDPGPYVARIRASGVRVVAQVQDGATARQAVRAGVDVLVAQGHEAGGHTGAVGLMPLLQLVLALGDEAGIPVLAAGGIATGRGIAGALAMGCAGVWLGTRFAATVEALGTTAAKEAIVRADETQTVHTHVFDLIQEIPWPDEFPGRALRNDFTARWHGHDAALVADLAAAQQGFEAAWSRDDYREAYIYAGEAVGLIRDLPMAGEVITRLAAEAEATLRRAADLLR
jgi:nitronate monooxygenase